MILRSPHRFGSSRKTKTVIGPLSKPTTFYAVFLSIDHTLLIFSNRIPLDSPPPVVVPGWDSTVGAAFWVKPRAATSRTQHTGRGPAPPKPRRPGPDSGVGGVPAPVQRRRRGCYATPLQEVGSDPDRIVFQWTRTWSWPKLMGCAKPRGAPQVAPVPTLQKPTESGPKPLQCRSAHRRNASASSKPNHCRPPFPPWYWFGVVEFAPVGFPTLCCGARVGSCGHRIVLGRAEKRKRS